MKILITGAGSVMGQSIYKALTLINFPEATEVHFANSDDRAAGRHFNHPNLPVTATPIFPLARDENYVDFVEQYVRDHNIDIVYPGTQHELERITQFHKRMQITATIPTDIAMICLDKFQTPQMLKDNGIRYPETLSVTEYLSTAQNDRPVIIKPITSSASRNIFRGNSQQDIKDILDQNNLKAEDFILQDRLIGPEYTCGCYIDRFSNDINTICFERTLTPDGATGYGKIINDADIRDYVVSVGRALQKSGMKFGHINVQLIKDDKGPCLFEINGRLSSTEAPKAHFGFNSCAAYFSNIVLQQPYAFDAIAPTGEFMRFYEEIYF